MAVHKKDSFPEIQVCFKPGTESILPEEIDLLESILPELIELMWISELENESV